MIRAPQRTRAQLANLARQLVSRLNELAWYQQAGINTTALERRIARVRWSIRSM